MVDDGAAGWLIKQSMDDVEGDEAAEGNRASAVSPVFTSGCLDDFRGFGSAADKW
jgi:hypothetical protein